MDDVTRRGVLQLTAAAGVAVALGAAARADDEDAKKLMTDRKRVLACGLTEDEADCWELAAKVAGKFFQLPKLHPMDNQEVATAIHIIQHKLLARPTYRKYLELAKKAQGK